MVTPTWSIVLPKTFARIEHETDWRAHDAHRVVFLSSSLVTASNGGPTMVDVLEAELRGGLESVPGTRGSVAIFQHKLRHEGVEVRRGTKYALRSDTIYARR